mgnify:CR=1 FL=1
MGLEAYRCEPVELRGLDLIPYFLLINSQDKSDLTKGITSEAGQVTYLVRSKGL